MKNKAAQELGKSGGQANVQKYGKKHMKRISALGVAARKKNRLNNDLEPQIAS